MSWQSTLVVSLCALVLPTASAESETQEDLRRLSKECELGNQESCSRIARVAQHDQDVEARRSATMRLADSKVLASIAGDDDEPVRPHRGGEDRCAAHRQRLHPTVHDPDAAVIDPPDHRCDLPCEGKLFPPVRPARGQAAQLPDDRAGKKIVGAQTGDRIPRQEEDRVEILDLRRRLAELLKGA